ncbi:general secretion pathway protein GspN [Lysobacter panacisoli]|uniref:General secretion pathway protein XpsN n=1 Tax=Lysobacter panacisoli TaxID=1255263 RepID=A0ABP9L4C5_9GAMM|nr:general secretion pathway protein GspN [Lysobacter panacisoli]
MRLDEAGPRTWVLATIAGWAVLAWLLAVLGMGKHAQALEPDPSLLRPLPPLRQAPPERLGPISQYAQIGQRPLFSQDRQPKAFYLQGQGGGEGEQTAFDYLLTSVLITPSLKMAILQPADGSESVRVKLGEVPESHPSWRLTALDARSAVFEGAEGRREMTLRVFDGQGGQPPTAVGTAPTGPNVRGPQPVGTSVPGAAPGFTAVPPAANVPPRAANAIKPAASGNRTSNTNANTAPPAPPPVESAENAPLTPEAQMEAIRKRIEARRAQMRQQNAQPPAQTP